METTEEQRADDGKERSGAKRWSVDEAREVMARLEQSGLSAREFAKREGLDTQRLYKWRVKLAELAGNGDTAVRFTEVAKPSLRSVATSGFEVALKNGRVIRVGAHFDPVALKSLLEVADS